jgi:hypothetical protein
MKKVLIMTVLSVLVTACGGAVKTDPSQATTTSTVAGTTSSVVTTTTTSGSSTTGNTSGYPAYAATFSLASGASQTFSVQSDSVLKVRINGGSGRETIPGTGYNFQYGCAQFNVTANGKTLVTQVMKIAGANNSMCPSAPTYVDLDFSANIGYSASIDVKVSAAKSDWRCLNAYSGFCPVADIYTTHVMNDVQVQIQSNNQYFTNF